MAVDHVEETSQESPREIQDVHAGTAMGGRGEDAWRLEPEGERETMETEVVSDGVEGVCVDTNSEGRNGSK